MTPASPIQVKKRNGRLEPINIDKINKCAERACEGLPNVSASEIVLDAHMQLFNKVSTAEIDKALILSAKAKIVKEPSYAYATARLLLNTIYKEVFGEGVDHEGFEWQYRKAFVTNLKKLVKADRVDPRLLDYDLKRLAEHIKVERDNKFKYLGIQTLYDRYFLHIEERRMETPQAFWMRVAMGLALNQADKNASAIEYYDLFSQMKYCPSTPTLFNSGTNRSQLSSCYLSTFEDSIDGIWGGIHNQARLSKYAGGLGGDWGNIRGDGSWINGTNGRADGVIPWLKGMNTMVSATNQGGKRKGVSAVYLPIHHIDFPEFMEIRKVTGDERRRCHDIDNVSWIPDEFMKRVKADQPWYMFCPSDTRILNETFGLEFEKHYNNFCQLAEQGVIKNFKKVQAKDLWKKALTMLKETGHPWITFKDPSNYRYSNQHVGIVRSSNLCTEILLHTVPTTWKDGEVLEYGETAVCNLGSLNLPELFRLAGRDKPKFFELLKETAGKAIRILNAVIDINFYPTVESKKSNLAHRPVGLGVMGFHDLLREMGILYSSKEAIQISDVLFENISWAAIRESALIAKEDGPYSTYKGSLWDQGIFPIDTYNQLMEIRGHESRKSGVTLDWDSNRALVKQYGVRNSNTMAIAPTASIADLLGPSPACDPNYGVAFPKQTLSGSFMTINEYFVDRCKALGIWCDELSNAIQKTSGDISTLNLPQYLKDEFCTAFDQDQHILIECAAARQKWIDMGQSLNLFSKSNSLKALNDMYMLAWESGLKTTYYLHNPQTSKIESTTTTTSAVSQEASACSIEAMRNGTSCESCQ